MINVLLVIASVVAILLTIAFFAPKNYSLSRNILINAPANVVFDYISHIKNQDHFSKWVMTDPNMNKSFRGTDGTVGFVYAWEGNKKAGKGEQEITRIKASEQLDIEVRFEKPFRSVAQTPFRVEATGENQSKVTWGMSSRMNYPMNLMLLFVNMDGMLGKSMEESLELLKGILEEKK